MDLPENGEPWVNIVPTTQEILSNTDDAYETTLFIHTFELRNQPVAPGYEWLVDRLASAPSDPT